jgi:hypothetical protein
MVRLVISFILIHYVIIIGHLKRYQDIQLLEPLINLITIHIIHQFIIFLILQHVINLLLIILFIISLLINFKVHQQELYFI